MRKEAYTADFETTTTEPVRVWGWAIASIETVKVVKRGTTLDEFMTYIENKNIDIYFHNLKFDGSFIIPYLLKHGWQHDRDNLPHTFSTLIADTNQWYNISIVYKRLKKRYVRVQIYDSLKKLPFKVERIARAFNLEIRKGSIDYDAHRPIGYQPTEDEWEYIDNDVLIMAGALRALRDQNMKAMTIGADALKAFKATLGHKLDFRFYFPVLPKQVDDFIRRSYKGGWTYLNPLKKGQRLQGLVFDVNSLYPYVMYDYMLPYGKPIMYVGDPKPTEQYPLYIQKLRCAFKLKKGKLPTIQIKSGRFVPTDYLIDSDDEIVELTLSSVDLTLFLDHYDVYNLEYVGGVRFKASNTFFKTYIDYWSDIKAKSEGALREIAKLMLNSLYGKFATITARGKIEPFLSDDKLKGRLEPIEIVDANYTALGVFITANARDITIRNAQSNYNRFIYADTDSLHLEGMKMPALEIHKTKLGAWKHESVFDDSKYLRAKTYMDYVRGKNIKLDDGEIVFKPVVDGTHTHCEWQITVAGLPDYLHDQVTPDNFNEGMIYDGKLRPVTVDGGVILERTTFKIKGGNNEKNHAKFTITNYDQELINHFKQYKNKIDLRSIKDDVKYHNDNNSVFALWSSGKQQGIDMETVAHELMRYGYTFNGETSADMFIDFDQQYRKALLHVRDGNSEGEGTGTR